MKLRFFLAILICFPLTLALFAQEPTKLNDDWAGQIKFRSIGPANMMGRITSIAVCEEDPCIWWAASASGGLLKTTNNGINFEHQFDDQATVSIGDVQVAKSNKDIVWVGTGESNPRNSVSWGDGVYKSTDGGATWKNMGLKEIFQTGAIAIHPENPDIVYVGALGRLWGPNPERGLFKTTDGGETWKKVLYVNDQTGVIDVQMNPQNPDELLIATYERQRDGFDGNDPEKKYGDGSAIYKTTDGGESFKKISEGLPTCKLGRIGLDYYHADPNYVFAIVESEKIATEPEDAPFLGLRGENADVGAKVTDVTKDGPSDKAGIKEGDIIVSVEGAIVHSYDDMLGETRKHRAGDKINLVISRERKQVDIEVALEVNPQIARRQGAAGERRAAGGRGGRGRAGAGRRAAAGGQTGNEESDSSGGESESGDESESGGGEGESGGGESGEGEGESGGGRGARGARGGRGGANTRTPFTGTLGGQAPNLQDQQGEDGHEYGGIYMSSDGGDTWKRINTLNPRPMYYSHIRVDPTDRQRVYVCGTSLYKSEDGGKTFTGDGGSDGIHVDHHALWIDPRDSRHMLLGNDGGIYVTYDRMKHWDHHNHAAIGQFYHVGVDSTMNYKVYGGLQDNGSWGGPSRSAAGDGTINSDWFRVGGGDGFITLVDPEDKDQIYFESQNGGMGRINLRTGDRGFIRPRPPRGTRYRFNWKSPFILSPHNSKVFYSAGNFVFRSMQKGDKIAAISPEITNTDQGAGSAISESPVEPGVLYVGTTDGAVWMTKDGGKNWTALYSVKEAKKNDDSAESKENDTSAETEEAESNPESKTDEPAEAEEAEEKEESKPADEAKEMAPADDPVTGSWSGNLISERIPEDRSGFKFKLKLSADGAVSGEMENRRGDLTEFDGGKFDAETGAISWAIESERGSREYSGTLKNGELTGEMTAGGGRFQMEFKATRDKEVPLSFFPKLQMTPIMGNSVIAALQFYQAKADDPVTGNWKGVIENENIPNGRVEFTIELKMDKDGNITGMVVSPMGEVEVFEGKYDPDKKQVVFTASSEEGDTNLDFTADIKGASMSGLLTVNDQMQLDFDAAKEASSEPQEESTPQEKQEDEPKADPKTSDEMKAEEKAAEPAAKQEPAVTAVDPVSGEWKGTLDSPRGSSEFTMVLKRNSNESITGTYETERGEGEITEGTYDPSSRKLSVVSDNGRFTLEFNGEVEGDKFAGEVDFNGGQFSMEFEATRTSKPQVAQSSTTDGANQAAKKASAESETTLADLMPGPRWVSSIEASRFKAGRCYITFDGHRSNDDEPYLFVTEDYGNSWKSIRADLPTTAGSVRVLREDVKNENLLYLGCEFSAWFSVDRGKSWNRFTGLPTVAVHEFAVHPKAGDVVVGTHGRAIWIADVSLLQQMTPETVAADAHLYRPKDVIRWRQAAGRGDNGTREFKGQDPPSGTTIAYSLGKSARNIEMSVSNVKGEVIRRFEPSTSKGLHTLDWDLRLESNNGPRGGGGQRFGRGPTIGTGTYLVELRVDGKLFFETFTVHADPDTPSDAVAEDELMNYWLELGQESGNDR